MSTKHKRRIKYLAFTLAPAVLVALIALVSATSSGSVADAQEQPPCATCHNNTTLIEGKATAWADTGHGTGTAYLRGTSKSCAGCHSGGGFSAMIASGLEPNSAAMVGDPTPTRQDCRACHQIHTSYTGVDWALETIAAVSLYAMPGNTYDGGNGNLCAKCHQPRTAPPVASGGMITVSGHFGPHHGPQSSMLLGIGGAGATGTSAAHYQYVTDTCSSCHMGANDSHSFTPAVTACTGCHAGATNFDINGKQTLTQTKLDTLKGLLVSAGLLSCEIDAEGVEECHAVAGTYPEAQANALWNWVLIAEEDSSKGVHNMTYTQTLLDNSIAAMSS